MAALNEARRLLERGKVYISVTCMIIILALLYLLDVEMTPSIEEHLRCGLALIYNITVNDTIQPIMYETTTK